MSLKSQVQLFEVKIPQADPNYRPPPRPSYSCTIYLFPTSQQYQASLATVLEQISHFIKRAIGDGFSCDEVCTLDGQYCKEIGLALVGEMHRCSVPARFHGVFESGVGVDALVSHLLSGGRFAGTKLCLIGPAHSLSALFSQLQTLNWPSQTFSDMFENATVRVMERQLPVHTMVELAVIQSGARLRRTVSMSMAQQHAQYISAVRLIRHTRSFAPSGTTNCLRVVMVSLDIKFNESERPGLLATSRGERTPSNLSQLTDILKQAEEKIHLGQFIRQSVVMVDDSPAGAATVQLVQKHAKWRFAPVAVNFFAWTRLYHRICAEPPGTTVVLLGRSADLEPLASTILYDGNRSTDLATHKTKVHQLFEKENVFEILHFVPNLPHDVMHTTCLVTDLYRRMNVRPLIDPDPPLVLRDGDPIASSSSSSSSSSGASPSSSPTTTASGAVQPVQLTSLAALGLPSSSMMAQSLRSAAAAAAAGQGAGGDRSESPAVGGFVSSRPSSATAGRVSALLSGSSSGSGSGRAASRRISASGAAAGAAGMERPPALSRAGSIRY